MSTLEIISTVLGVWSYIEIIRRKTLGLVLGLVAVLLLACLFYQHRLYSDMALMLYYAVASLTALFFWRRTFRENRTIQITRLSHRTRRMLLIGLPLAIGLLAVIASHLHLWLPALFPEAARIPLGDAITTVLGITASILIIRRKVEAMAFWLIGDILSTFIYARSGIYFLASVYIAYVLIDAAGLLIWTRRLRNS